MKRIMMIPLLLASMITAKAQSFNPVQVVFGSKMQAGGLVVIYMKATIDEGWHIYSVNQKAGGPQKTTFEFLKSPDYESVGKVTEPKPESKYDQVFGMQADYFTHEVKFQQAVRIKKDGAVIKVKMTYMACNNKQCLSPKELSFEVPLGIPYHNYNRRKKGTTYVDIKGGQYKYFGLIPDSLRTPQQEGYIQSLDDVILHGIIVKNNQEVLVFTKTECVAKGLSAQGYEDLKNSIRTNNSMMAANGIKDAARMIRELDSTLRVDSTRRAELNIKIK